MKLDLNEIAANLGKKLSYDIDEPPFDADDSGFKWPSRITGRATFTNSGGHIIVHGSFKTKVGLECSRCLRYYEMELELPIDEALPLHASDILDEDELEIDEGELLEDNSEPLFENNIYNITELMRQTALLAVPIKHLCSDECGGICPRCGKVLDSGPCACPEDSVNSPFAGLAALLEDDEENTEGGG